MPFLDVLVECCLLAFISSIYRKPTFTGSYLTWDVSTPKSKKVNLIKCLIFKALKICSDNKIKSEFEQIKNLFWVTGTLRKSLLTPLTKLLISLGITSAHLAFLNAQLMLDFFGLDLLASWLPIRFLLLWHAVIMWLWFEPSWQLELHFTLFSRMGSLSFNKAT